GCRAPPGADAAAADGRRVAGARRAPPRRPEEGHRATGGRRANVASAAWAEVDGPADAAVERGDPGADPRDRPHYLACDHRPGHRLRDREAGFAALRRGLARPQHLLRTCAGGDRRGRLGLLRAPTAETRPSRTRRAGGGPRPLRTGDGAMCGRYSLAT